MGTFSSLSSWGNQGSEWIIYAKSPAGKWLNWSLIPDLTDFKVFRTPWSSRGSEFQHPRHQWDCASVVFSFVERTLVITLCLMVADSSAFATSLFLFKPKDLCAAFAFLNHLLPQSIHVNRRKMESDDSESFVTYKTYFTNKHLPQEVQHRASQVSLPPGIWWEILVPPKVNAWKWSESEIRSVLPNSLQPHGLYSPWNSPGQNIGVGGHSLRQGIFPTQGSNPGLPHCRQILYCLSPQGNPRILEWVAYLFSRLSSPPGNRTRVSWIAGRFFTSWATREAHRVNA